MADVAELGFKVDSREVETASERLDRLSSEATKAGRSADKFKGDAGRAATATAALGSSAERSALVMGRLRSAFIGFAQSAVAQLAAVAAGTAGLASAIQAARDFDAALAEVSTLMGDNVQDIDRLGDAARRMAREFGGAAASQVQGFYQAISAGASSVEQASAVLEAANRTAIGGVTDVKTAVDILTTATNAYARQGLTAADAADTLFVGMRAGKTTIGKLASTLGNVIPIAGSLGVGFDELVASVSALTTQGVSTARAVTGVRSILTAVAKPTAVAAEAAEQLGLNFTTAGIEALGFTGFMEEVLRATGGNADVMARLFGSVEALNAALSFAGGGGVTFAKIMDDMAMRTGAADEAFGRVSDTLTGRLNIAMGKLGDMSLSVGQTLLQVLVPAIEAMVTWLPMIARMLTVVAAGMAAAFGPTILAMVLKLATAIGVTTVAAVNALTVAIARNPFGALAIGITMAVTALIAFRDKTVEVMGTTIRVGGVLEAVWVTAARSVQATTRYVVGLLNALRLLTNLDFSGAAQALTGAGAEIRSAGTDIANSWRAAFDQAAQDAGELIVDEMGAAASDLQVAALFDDLPIFDGLVTSAADAAAEAVNIFADLRNEMARGIQVEQVAFLEATGQADEAAKLRQEMELIDLIARGQGELTAQQIDYLSQQLAMQQQIRAETKAALNLDRVRQELAATFESDFERRQLQYEQQLEILREALDAELLTRDEYRNLEMEAIVAFDEWKLEQAQRVAKEQAIFEHELAEESRRARDQTLSGTQSFFANMAAASSAGGKKLFAITKAFRIAETIISTYAGATRAFADLPWPLSAAVAASIVATGLANVATIASTNPGSGGGGRGGGRGGGGGGARNAPVAPPAPRAQDVTIRLDGDRNVFTRRDIEQILEGLNDALADGAQIRVAR